MTSPMPHLSQPSPNQERTTTRRSLRPLLGALGVGALVVALAAPATAAPRPSTSSSRGTVSTIRYRTAKGTGTCPAVPTEPKASTGYSLNGQTWNPADPIDWTLDTTNLGATSVPKRVTDIKRALADAARVTGFTFVYKGEVKSESPKPAPLLIQFGYVPKITGPYAGSLGEQTNSYLEKGNRKQTIDADITLLSSLAAHYGSYDSADPTLSPEGDVLLHEVGAVLGLNNVPTSPPEVMSSEATPATYFLQYQAGDNYGLWKVGASRGCGGYPI